MAYIKIDGTKIKCPHDQDGRENGNICTVQPDNVSCAECIGEYIIEIAEKEEPMETQEVALLYGKGYECKNCGNELSVNEFNGIYCHWCGQKLEW